MADSMVGKQRTAKVQGGMETQSAREAVDDMPAKAKMMHFHTRLAETFTSAVSAGRSAVTRPQLSDQEL
jgi:hypothetical protein